MPRVQSFSLPLALFLSFCATLPAPAQQTGAPAPQGRAGGAGPGRGRPPLFFKELWKQNAKGGEHPVVAAEALSNPDLELKLYGPSANEVLMTGIDGDDANPTHLWTGMCTTACAATFRHKTNFADLTGLARIRWNTKMSGFHQVRPIVKLADGTWLAGDKADGSVTDWLVTEIALSEVRWLRLDIEKLVTKGNFVEKPDLSRVDEIGYVDLMPGSGHGPGGWSDVAQVEVFARAVKR